MRLLIAAVTAALALTTGGAAQASPNIVIESVNCTFHIELTYIKNFGDAPQDLAGWELRSDPETSEHLAMAFIGTLDPGEEIIIVGGPHGVTIPAEYQYAWGPKYSLRDDDLNDYVRMLDAAGSQVDGMNCAGGPVDLSTPTATPAPTPVPTPAPAAALAAPTPAPVAVARANQPRTDVEPAAPAADSDLPAGGGLPPAGGDAGYLPILLGLAAIAGGALLMARGGATRLPRQARSEDQATRC
jgi:hypothetical protein